ncbi:hypothetical protein [Streptomyces lancefieldiae]|uniref:Type VII secretion system-associated protein n=1 Tax=Streptomyces lancefieldiae TaxID=3075520 RepID=A0ABU3APR8_9ACTN|nr:hypothetical protein [Streptomyces sp. DSM 40712]MDT0612190.1 hypothetical protein [Streptomyces sp. DSM 40712]
MAEDGGTATYKISSEYLQGFARDEINTQFLGKLDSNPNVNKLRGYGGQSGAGEYDNLLAGNTSSSITSAKALQEDFRNFATDMVKLLEELKGGMLRLSDNLISVDHITQQGEQDANEIALQSMMDDLMGPLAMFGGGNTQPTTGQSPTLGN